MVTEDDLKQLPLRAIVAFVARCARRVQPLYRLPEGCPRKAEHETGVDLVIQAAERFALGDLAAYDAAYDAARAAVRAADNFILDVAIDEALEGELDVVLRAARAAHDVANAAYATLGYALDARPALDVAHVAHVAARVAARAGDAAYTDYENLLALRLSKFPDLGQAIDPSESGPLGPLWPDGAPKWFARNFGSGTGENGELVVEIEVPDGVSDDEVLSAVERISLAADDLHRSLGGHGLRVKRLEITQEAGVPVGAPRG
jgi:hypothetical protein